MYTKLSSEFFVQVMCAEQLPAVLGPANGKCISNIEWEKNNKSVSKSFYK